MRANADIGTNTHIHAHTVAAREEGVDVHIFEPTEAAKSVHEARLLQGSERDTRRRAGDERSDTRREKKQQQLVNTR